MFTNVICTLRLKSAFCWKAKLLRVLYSSQAEHAERNVANVVNVAIIGAPNSGKSTLINKIVERKVCAASNKVHTTTKMIRAMCYENDTQIIFLDTPGIVSDKEQKKYKLPESMLKACHKSLRCANVIGVVHDISNRWSKDSLHFDVVKMLKLVENIPSFLILNKVDVLKSKKQLLDVIKNLTNGQIAGSPIPGVKRKSVNPERGYSNFSDVFLVSALHGDGIADVKQYLMNNAKPATLQYSAKEWTDQCPETLIEETVRATFLDYLSQEIPYKLSPKLEYFEDIEGQDKILCSVAVDCPSERLAKLISGAGGGRLQQIKSSARSDLIALFKKPVVLDILLKVKSKELE